MLGGMHRHGVLELLVVLPDGSKTLPTQHALGAGLGDVRRGDLEGEASQVAARRVARRVELLANSDPAGLRLPGPGSGFSMMVPTGSSESGGTKK